MNETATTETFSQLLREQLLLLGRLLIVLRNLTAARKLPAVSPDLTLDIAEMSPRVDHERDEEVAATD